MTKQTARCLILACGNTLREDDGIGPFLAAWAEERFSATPGVRVIARHQWTPEISEDIAQSDAVIFIDCAMNAVPGSVSLVPVKASAEQPRLLTHHLDAAGLLSLAREYYAAVPHAALLLSVGAASLELREGISDAVQATIPEAQRRIENAVAQLLSTKYRRE